MNKLYLSPYLVVLIVGNCVAAILLAQVANSVRETYEHLPGGVATAPGGLVLATGLPQWFWLLAILAFVAGIALFVGRLTAAAFIHCLLVVAILDFIVLFFFALGIGLYFIPPLEKVGL